MPRIPGVATKDAGPLIRVGYWIATRRFRVVPEPFSVLAGTASCMAAARHEMAAEKASKKLPKNVRELAVYRVAQQLGCSWCVDFGDEGVLELTYQIGLENMRARMYSALDVRDQGFRSGDACRPPEVELTARNV